MALEFWLKSCFNGLLENTYEIFFQLIGYYL